MKRPFYIFALFIILSFVYIYKAPFTYAQIFTDVNYDHPHGTAISYLKSNNIIQGYPDGSFRPDDLITRTEFLKIVLEGTNVPLDIETPTNFSDIDENEWYAPYIKKAKSEGWIKGYPDGTFKPLQPINKVEALKILGEVQEWDRLDLAEVPEAAYKDTYRFSWYSPYVHFAKENGLLFEETDYLYPSQEITRGYMAELMYRSMIRNVITYVPGQTAEDKINEAAKSVDTPDNFTTINIDYFDNIKLDSELPNTFYKNEIYFIEGDITNGKSYDTIFAFLTEENGNSSNYEHFIGEISGTHFEIPIFFDDPGTYHLGIIPGLSGESKIIPIYVLDGIPKAGTKTNENIPTNLSIKFENDTTSISWKEKENNVFRIYFIQEDNVVSYFVRGKNNLDLFYSDFKNFTDGNVKWRVYGAKANSLTPINLTTKWAKSSDSIFKAIKHHFKLTVDESVTYSNFPELLSSAKSFSVSGTTNENIFAEGAVIKPDGNVDTFEINSSKTTIKYYGNDVIPAGSSFNFTYNPTMKGTYILEINDQGGAALINIPIYIGDGIPLIPDFFDLQDPYEITETLDLEKSRQELLTYLNEERSNYGLNTVEIRDDLNSLAQAHSDDMKNRNFFSHFNPEGLSPNERRINAGINTEVGENLAHAPTVYFGHKALMRSAIHRENILNPNWDSVGIGISLDENGYLLITEEFSHDPWTDNDLEKFENDILTAINTERSNSLTLNSVLQDVAREWSSDMINENFFSFTSPSGINLIDIVHGKGITQEGRAFILKEGSIETLTSQLLSESDIKDNEWKQIGIGIKQDEFSNLYLTIIYTQ
jgi:uncharacterized protein YkwD